MPNFKLTDEKIKDIVKFCDAIYDRSRELQVKDYILDRSRTGKEINLQGMGAEIWYKEKHGLPYNLDATLDAGPRTYKKDVDCVRDGFKLEVKQTSYPTGCLFIASVDHYNRPRKLISDMYVLIIGNFPNYSNDLHISDVTLTNKYFDKTSNALCPTMHPKIGKFGYHVEQDEMYETFEEAVKSDGRTTKRDAPTLS